MAGLFVSSCSDYLDVVPDNVPTLDHAFANRHACEGYLFTCYSYFARNGRLLLRLLTFRGRMNFILVK